nr:semaphorin-3F isoform X3 [Camelus dromedarius]
MPVAGLLLWASLLTGAWPATPTQDHLLAMPRVRLSFKELKATGTAHFFNFLLNTTDYRILLKDEDHDRMYVGSKDYVLSLDLHDINREPLIIHWAASPQRIEECVLSGKDGNGECGNFVRLIQPWNRTHLYVCGTGAYNPMCTYVNRGRRAQATPWTQMQVVRGRGSRATDGALHPTPTAPRQDYIFYLEPERLESGKGKCPYDPKLDTASALINEELYAGVYIDFMGTDAAIFRTLGKQTAMRTDQYNSRWLNDPAFIHAELIPDSAERNDDKLYFFFRERSAEAPQNPAVYARIGRICLNDDGGHCCLVNKWSTFLKARLVCSVPGDDGIETHFDELQDVFVQQTQDVRNPVIYAVFTSSGSVFRGSAVCVYSMADIRMVFNGPFAHKEGPNYQWMPFSGKMPYPRPGTCPGGTFTPSMKSTKDYPDEVINFMRSHPLMYQAVYPLQRRPLVVRTGAPYRLTTVAVDQVDAADGRYEVLFLGTDRGTVQKVIVLPKDDQEMEELMLEEVEVFKDPAPVKTMTISSKRQQLYVASAVGVTHLSLHRCQAYGAACADCCLARDPYCAWDGQACSRYTASSKRSYLHPGGAAGRTSGMGTLSGSAVDSIPTPTRTLWSLCSTAWRGAQPSLSASPAHPRPLLSGCSSEIPVTGAVSHREQFQARHHTGAAACPGPRCRPCCPLPTASCERPTAPRRRPPNTPLPGAGPAAGPAGSGPHPPVLPGLLAPRASQPQGGPRGTQAS